MARIGSKPDTRFRDKPGIFGRLIEDHDRHRELAARDMAKGSWLVRFGALKEEYLHHIREEEQELFEAVSKHLDRADRDYMEGVFSRRKPVEKDKAEVTPALHAAH